MQTLSIAQIMRPISALGGLTLLALLILSKSAWPAPTLVRMSQAVDTLSYLPVYAARANRFFEDEGINLEVIIMQGGGPELQALIAGSVDFSATGTTGLLRVFSGGGELLGVQNLLGRCIVDLVVRKDTAERLGVAPQMPFEEKLKRLRGTKVGASRVGAISYQIPVFLAKEAGLEPGRDIVILGVGGGASQLAALKIGHVDIMSNSPPWPAIAIKEGIASMLLANTKGEHPKLRKFQQQVLVVRPEFARQNPDLVRRVVRALIRGSGWVAENSPETVSRAVSKFFQRTQADVLSSTVEGIKSAVVPNGRFDLDGLHGVEQVLRVNGIIRETVPWDRLVTNEFLPK